jgi:hypothetical protein
VQAATRCLHIKSINTRAPTLEEVFVSITGGPHGHG